MKKFIISILFITFALLTNAQSRLGYTLGSIKAEYSNSTVGWTNEGVRILTVEQENFIVFYYFTPADYCNYTVIVPNDMTILSWYIEKYNRSYVIIDNKNWKMYSSEGVADIELVFTEDSGYLIIWSNAE